MIGIRIHRFRVFSATFILLLAVGVLYNGCYWQPDSTEDNPGGLSVRLHIPASLQQNLSGAGLTAQQEGAENMIVLILFQEEFFTSIDRQDNVKDLFEEGFPRFDNAALTIDDILTEFPGLHRSHYQELSTATSPGSYVFDSLAPGNYVVLAKGGSTSADAYAGMGHGTVVAGSNDATISIGLDVAPVSIYDFLIAQYQIPFTSAHPAGGKVYASLAETPPWAFIVGGVSRQYLDRVGTAYRHRLSIFESGTQFNSEGQISSTDKSYLEFTVVTDEFLIEDWPETNPFISPITFDDEGPPPRVERLRAYILSDDNGTLDKDWDFAIDEVLSPFFNIGNNEAVGVPDDGFLPLPDIGFFIAVDDFTIDSDYWYPICFDAEAEYDPDAESGLPCELLIIPQ